MRSAVLHFHEIVPICLNLTLSTRLLREGGEGGREGGGREEGRREGGWDGRESRGQSVRVAPKRILQVHMYYVPGMYTHAQKKYMYNTACTSGIYKLQVYTDTQTDRQTDRQTQTDRETDRQRSGVVTDMLVVVEMIFCRLPHTTDLLHLLVQSNIPAPIHTCKSRLAAPPTLGFVSILMAGLGGLVGRVPTCPH